MRAGRRGHVGRDNVAVRNGKALAYLYSGITRLPKRAVAYSSVCGLSRSDRGEQDNAREKKERGDKESHIATSDTRIKFGGIIVLEREVVKRFRRNFPFDQWSSKYAGDNGAENQFTTETRRTLRTQWNVKFGQYPNR